MNEWSWPPDIASLLLDQGYPLESHFVTTEDDYVLEMFRVPRYACQQGGQRAAEAGATEADDNSTQTRSGSQAAAAAAHSARRGSVLLMHGLLDSAAAWVANDASESLAFLLHDRGWDVWLGNARGSTWGMRHKTLKQSQAEFWRFTWDEIALHDLPAMLQHVLDVTGDETVAYVGHSQGTTALLAALSSKRDLQNHISVAALLAPVAYARHTESTLLKTLASINSATVLARFGELSFLPGRFDESMALPQLCARVPLICAQLLTDVAGSSSALNTSRLATYLHFVPAGTSVANMEHWAQSVRASGSLVMRAMDWGSDCSGGSWGSYCNRKAYRDGVPTVYNLSHVRVPLGLFSGDKDVLATPMDVELLRESLLGSTLAFSRMYPGYSHLDFTWGMNAHTDVYPDVIQLLESRSKSTAQ